MPFARANDIQMYYECHGEGEALMLLSGTGETGDHWHVFQAPAFSEAHQVITFDYRGLGQSDKPDAPYSTRQFAADAAGLLEALVLDRAHFMGHSMGGRVAQWVALDHPDRVRSLVLSSTGSGQYAPEVDVVRGLPLKQTLAMVEQGYDAWWLAHFADEDFWYPPEVRAARPDLLGERRALSARTQPPLRSYLRHVIARQQHETTDRLGEIRAPSLALVGSRDTHVGGTGSHLAGAHALAQAIPGARLVVMEGAAHGYLWQMPDQANQVILDFLAEVDGNE